MINKNKIRLPLCSFVCVIACVIACPYTHMLGCSSYVLPECQIHRVDTVYFSTRCFITTTDTAHHCIVYIYNNINIIHIFSLNKLVC